MARAKKFLDIDVLTAARDRIRHIADTHDTLVVNFSGGKDSLVVLHLAREVLIEERGQERLKVLFRDEELIPNAVVDFVQGYMAEPWVEPYYFAVPLKSQKFILGRTYSYVQWDPGREWVRPKPANAITEPEPAEPLHEFTADPYFAQFFKGKVAFLTGIRAAESLIRLRASVNKLNENYINACSDPRVSLCKPIYDWQENDVFRYFYEQGIRYCPFYDSELWAGAPLRVATPIHAEAAKQMLPRMRAMDPVLYQQIVTLFPEMEVQERYWREFDNSKLKERYAGSFKGLRDYVEAEISDPRMKSTALRRLRSIEKRELLRPGSYPTEYVFKWLAGGAFHRELLPVRRQDKPA